MSKTRLVMLVVIAGLALVLAGARSPHRAETASVDPSWELIQGEPNSCSNPGTSLFTTVLINVSGTASEKGEFFVPGYGGVGFTIDTAFGPGSGSFGFTVFMNQAYTVPDHTPVTLTVTTYNQSNFLGGVSYVSSLTWDCTTGEILPQAGCDILLPVPATAVGGTFVANAPTYWTPGQLTDPLVTIEAGKSARVIGLDASGQYYKIAWACDFLWVPKDTIGPNYDNVWNGAPLPTAIVN